MRPPLTLALALLALVAFGAATAQAQGTLPEVSITALQDGGETPYNPVLFRIEHTGSTALLTVQIEVAVESTAVATTSCAPSQGGLPAVQIAEDAVVPQSVTFPPGQSVAIIQVEVCDDALVEDPELLTLAITPDPAYTIDPNAERATGEIMDNEPAEVWIEAVPAVVTEGDDIVFRFHRRGDTTFPLTVRFEGDASSTAVDGTDYTAPSFDFDIPAGASSADLTVAGLDDTMEEPALYLTFNVLPDPGPVPLYTPAAPPEDTATVRIDDDGDLPVVAIAGLADADEAGEVDGALRVTRTTLNTTYALEVSYATSGAADATQTPVPDYQPLSGTATIPVGVLFVDIPINVGQDLIEEATEGVVLSPIDQSDVAGGLHVRGVDAYLLDAAPDGAIQVFDDGDLPWVRVFWVADGDEGAGGPIVDGVFRVERYTQDASGPLTVGFGVSGTATPGEDYTLPSLTIGLAPGQLSADIPVTVLQDAIEEPPESVTILVDFTGAPYVEDPYMPQSEADVFVRDDDVATVNVSHAGDGREPATPARFRFVRDGYLGYDLRVSYSLGGSADRSQTPVADYADTGSVVIPAGQSSHTLVIDVLDDPLREPTEDIVLTLLDQPYPPFGKDIDAYAVGPSDTATALIKDDGDLPMVIVEPVQDGQEGGPGGLFRFTRLTQMTDGPLEVTYTVTGSARPDDGAAPHDYVALARTLTFAAGQTEVLVPVVVLDDELEEPAQDVRVELTFGPSYVSDGTGRDAASLLVLDDGDLPQLEAFEVSPGSEPGLEAVYGVRRLTEDPAVPLTFNFTTSGTATVGVDYVAFAGTSTIPAGALTVQGPVQVLDDGAVEPPETVILDIENGVGFVVLEPQPVTLFDDELPRVTIEPVQDGREAATPTPAVFRVTRNGDLSRPLDVHYQAVFVDYATSALPDDQSAAPCGGWEVPCDFVSQGGVVTIPAGQPSVLVTLEILDDDLQEPTQMLTLAVDYRAPGEYVPEPGPTARGEATVQVFDDGDQPLVWIRPGMRGADVAHAVEPATDGHFTIGRSSQETSAPLTIRLRSYGAATPEIDYELLPLTFTLPAGVSEATLPVPLYDDEVYEWDQPVGIQLLDDAGYGLSPEAEATILIMDNDLAPLLDIQGVPTPEGDNLTWTFRVMTNGTERPFSFVATMVDGTASSADYAASSDIMEVPGPLPIGSIAYLKTPTFQDDLDERDESVFLELSSVVGARAAPGSFVAKIVDDDLATVAVRAVPQAISEAALGPHFKLSRSGSDSMDTLVVSLSITGTAQRAVDFDVPSQVTFPSGASSIEVPVTIHDDAVEESDETIELSIVPTTRYAIDPERGQATMRVLNNDYALVSLHEDQPTGDESGTPATFLLRRDTMRADALLRVYLETVGTATAAVDYEALPEHVDFAAGVTEVKVGLKPLDDRLDENVEIAQVRIKPFTTYRIDPLRPDTDLDIHDDDESGVVFVAASEPVEVDEQGSAQIIGVRLSSQPRGLVLVGLATSDPTEMKILGATALPFSPDNWDRPQNVVVQGVQDNQEDGATLAFLVARILDAEDHIYEIIPPAKQAVLVHDDEFEVTASAYVTEIDEGQVAFVNFTRSRLDMVGETRLRVFIGGDATPGKDYDAWPALLAIPAGAQTLSYPLASIKDTTPGEDPEAFVVRLLDGNGFTIIGNDTVRIVINDPGFVPSEATVGGQPAEPMGPCMDAASSDVGSDCVEVEVVAPPDRDGDGVADTADNCIDLANKPQADLDSDGVGDACDRDRDGDTVWDEVPYEFLATDNCPDKGNVGQEDGDGDGLGDVCDDEFDFDAVAGAAQPTREAEELGSRGLVEERSVLTFMEGMAVMGVVALVVAGLLVFAGVVFLGRRR